MNPEDFWKPFELSVDSFDRVQELIQYLFTKWEAKDRSFAWRGLTDASWALHSSLYRRLLWTREGSKAPKEHHLYSYEGQILADVHRWGLHMAGSGRLSVLNQLAMLQHYGAPTRLVDVTFNPWIGLWFAVKHKWENGKRLADDRDGRLFAVDVTDRLVNELKDLRPWEDKLRRPWPEPLVGKTGPPTEKQKKAFYRWTTRTLAWRPPHFHPRIAAQNSGFIFSGVPATRTPTGSKQWPKGTKDAGRWKIDDVRHATSLALRVHKLQPSAGGPSRDAVYTIRIAADAKKDIRNKLQDLFGYTYSTLFPDFTGFAQFGTPELKSRE